MTQLKNLLKQKKSVDDILVSNLSIGKKIKLIDFIIRSQELNNIDSCVEITPSTMTLLLKEKKNTVKYIILFTKIVKFSKKNFSKSIFTYEHLYHLIIQAWMDLPIFLTNQFRKKLIMIALSSDVDENVNEINPNQDLDGILHDTEKHRNGTNEKCTLPHEILQNFKLNANEWFVNLNNPVISEMIDWLCDIDISGELAKIKNAYEKKLLEEKEIEKAFKKKFNMTRKEYETKQQIAKINGLCKFVRDNTKCPHGTNCNFYHGNLEETFAIQPCRNKKKCKFFLTGDCMFVHEPTKNQLIQINKFYKTLVNNNFRMTKSQSVYVDKQCNTNPFIILKKNEETNDYVKYCIPNCCCKYTDTLGVIHYCIEPVVFMTKKKSGDPLNFYCSYEHMTMYENPISYCIKQNVLKLIECL